MPLIDLRIRGRLFAGFGALILFGVALAGFAGVAARRNSDAG